MAHSAELPRLAVDSEYVLRDMFGCHVRSNPRFDENFSDVNNLSKLNEQPQTIKGKASGEKAFTSTTATGSSNSATTATTATTVSSIQSSKAEKENQSKHPNTSCNVNINNASSTGDDGPLNYGTRQEESGDSTKDRGKKRERKGFRKLARKVVPRRLLRQSGSDDDGMVDLDSMSPYDSNGYVVDFQQLYPSGHGSGGGHSEAKDQAAKRAAAAVAKMQLAAAQARAALITAPVRTDGTGKVQGHTGQEEREDKVSAEKGERDLARESFVTVVTVPLHSELGLEVHDETRASADGDATMDGENDGDDGEGGDDEGSDGIVSVETGPMVVSLLDEAVWEVETTDELLEI